MKAHGALLAARSSNIDLGLVFCDSFSAECLAVLLRSMHH